MCDVCILTLLGRLPRNPSQLTVKQVEIVSAISRETRSAADKLKRIIKKKENNNTKIL